MHFFIDNDKPTVTSSDDTPVESTDIVTLTCEKATNDQITSHEWYADDKKIDGESSNKYTLPDNKRTNSGSFTCRIATSNSPVSPKSDTKKVTYLCKFASFPKSIGLQLTC